MKSVTEKMLSMSGCRSKVCRQCHRTKPLRAFISKNNEGICIICSTCRENQMRRYYEKKLRMQRAGMGRCYQKLCCTETQRPVPMSYLPLVPSSIVSFSSNQSAGVKPSPSFNRPLPLPCARWIAVKQFCSDSDSDRVYVAKLLYHPSSHQWMNQHSCPIMTGPDRKVQTDLSPVWTGFSEAEERG